MKKFLLVLCTLMSFSALAEDDPNVISFYQTKIHCSDANKIKVIRANIEDMKRQAQAFGKFLVGDNGGKYTAGHLGSSFQIEKNNIRIWLGISANDDLLNEAKSKGVITRSKIEIAIIGSDCLIIY